MRDQLFTVRDKLGRALAFSGALDFFTKSSGPEQGLSRKRYVSRKLSSIFFISLTVVITCLILVSFLVSSNVCD